MKKETQEIDYYLLETVQSGNLFDIKLLVKAGANPNCVNELGQTPIIIATKNGYTKIVHYLLECDVDITILDSENKTALDYIRDPEINDQQGNSALGYIEANEILMLLLTYLAKSVPLPEEPKSDEETKNDEHANEAMQSILFNPQDQLIDDEELTGQEAFKSPENSYILVERI